MNDDYGMEPYFDLDKDRYGDYGYNPDLLTEYSVWESSHETNESF